MNRLGIRNRVLVIALVPLLVTALALSSHSIIRRIDDIRQEHEARGQAIANQLALACEYGLFSGNRSELHRLSRAAAREPDVQQVWITDRAGARVAEARGQAEAPRAAGAAFTAPVYLSAIEVDDFARVLPLPDAAASLGTVHVALSAQASAARQRQALLEGLLITLLSLSLTALLAVRISRSATGPILRLTEAMQTIKKGALGHRVRLGTGGELGLLEQGINDMAIALEEARHRERKHAADALYLEQVKAQTALDSLGEGVITVDASGQVSYINPHAERLLGWPAAEALCQPLGQIVRIRRKGEATARPYPIEDCLREGRTLCHGADLSILRRDASQFAARDTATPIRNRDGEVTGAVLVFHDFTEMRRISDLLGYQATHDELTGLINRREFERKLEQAIHSTTRGGQHVLCYLDLDQFKVVNDTCGHAAGDELLRQLTFRLSAALRPGDVLARLGGDEFGVILRDCERKCATDVAETLRETVRNFRFVSEPYRFAVGVSIGVVELNQTSGTLADVMSAADSACYVAKERGRNRIHLYLPDDSALTQRQGEMHWLQRLNLALAESRFCLYAQAIIALDAPAERPHYELLLRMIDEDGDLVTPGAFLRAAERYQRMPALDRWVIVNAFSVLSASGAACGPAGPGFTLNLSGQSLGDEGLLDFLTECFATYGIDPRRITFEITETAAIANLSGAIHLMTTLKQRGCRFALDDFGSGLSSFGYLQNLPVDFIKIDGNFVRDMTDNALNLAMVEAINDIGHVMGLRTIAEFAETEAVLAQLRRSGVDYAQGYAIARPVPLQDILQTLDSRAGTQSHG